MRGLVPKFIMLIICLLHINYRPFDPCERVLTLEMALTVYETEMRARGTT